MSEVRFNLRNKNHETTSIYALYRIKGKRFRYSTREKIPPKYWSDSKMCALKSIGKAEAHKINTKLRKVKRLIYDIEAEFLAKDEPLTPDKLRTRLDEELFGIKKEEDVLEVVDDDIFAEDRITNFNKYIDIFIRRRDADPNFAVATIKVYKTFRRHWRRYCRNKHSGKRFEFDELSVPILEGFKFYLLNHKKKRYSDNLIDKMIRTGKVILNDATERGHNTNMDYKSKIFSHSPKPADNIYLTKSELKKIEDLDLSDHPQMEMHRDIFIIGAYTGLRYSDFSRIGKENITTVTDKDDKPVRVIKIFMKKVNSYVYIPIHPTVERLLKYHDYNLKQYKITNAVMNRHLKTIGEKAGLDDDVTKVTYRNKKGVKTKHKKYELITTHTARRSFATNAYKAGVPMLNIMRITGHKTSRSFLKYISFDDEENAVLMAEHEFFG
jgi:hypothetical protein